MSQREDKATLAIREMAQAWVIRLEDDAGPQARAAFMAWLRASPVHVREYLRAEAAWQAMRAASRGDMSDVQVLRQQAAILEGANNVVRMPPVLREVAPVAQGTQVGAALTAPGAVARDAHGRTQADRPRRRRFVAAAAAAVVATVSIVGFMLLQGPRAPGFYATEIGEMRRVILADGSAVELNTDSELRVDFHGASRDIHLLRGEAFFSVAKDPARPFRVISDAVLVRAVGTEFSVHHKPRATVVTVVEGRVAVQPRSARAGATRYDGRDAALPTDARAARAGKTPPQSVELAAGQQLQLAVDFRPDQPDALQASMVDPARAMAWRQRRLVFESDPLGEIVAEFNRYNRQKLELGDPQLATLRISGVFDPGKPESLVRFLVRDRKMEVRHQKNGGLLLVPVEMR